MYYNRNKTEFRELRRATLITINNEGNLAKMLVIGVGGGGNNAVNRMIDQHIKGVEYAVVNTDAQQLTSSKSSNKIQIGEKLTKGLGAGARPEIGLQAAEESKEELLAAIKEYDMLFITAGMGGGTGTGAAPLIAALAKELGILTIGIVTKPFEFEGPQRMEYAEKGIAALKQYVDTLLVIPNEKIFSIIDKKASTKVAYAKANEVLQQAVEGISQIIYEEGVINLDYNDAARIMKGQGVAHIGVGRASGEKRAEEAAKMAINSPLLETSIAGATQMLVNVIASEEVSMVDVKESLEYIRKATGQNANIIFGQVENDSLGDEMIVMVIATGFNGQPEANDFQINLTKQERSEEAASQQETAEAEKAEKSEKEGAAKERELAAQEPEIEIPFFLQKRKKG
ncbi:cell division protein FtsZ [Lachnospiraceae bacterium oral taxon 500]|nr:cell division protein FtsZ [Lachnospiraceae bacterium oral taxon 500]